MEQLERGLRRAYALVACCVLLACGQEPAAQDTEVASPTSVSTTSSTLAQACWPTNSTDEQKVCSDGWFFSIRCYKREASAACGPGADGGFALCRHSSHGEAPAPECQLDGVYTPPNHSLTQARAYAVARWNAVGGVGTPPFYVQPLCTSCTDLTANASDMLPTELALEMNTAAGRTPGRSGVSADGAATYSIPLWVPSGRMGMQPNLSVDYHSRRGDGVLGKGWSLNGISRITRCARTIAQDGAAEPIKFDATDRFCLDGVRLVAVNGPYGGHLTEYRTESNIFAKVVSFNPDDLGPTTFKAWLKDGRIMTFGDGWASRMEGLRTQVVPSAEPSGSTTTYTQARYAWSITHVHDRAGNFMQYVYAMLSGGPTDTSVEQWPTSITYTHSTVAGAPSPAFTISFFYTTRTDPSSEYVSGFKLGHKRLLEQVNMDGPGIGYPARLRYYRFRYDKPTITGANLLMSLQECTGEVIDGVCKNPTRFNWTQGATHFQKYDTQITDVARIPAGYPPDYPEHLWNIHTPDLNGDGKDDLLYREFIDPPNGLPQGIWWARLSTGNGFGPRRSTSLPPSVNYWNPVWNGRLADMDRDGKVDLVRLKENTGLYEVYRSRGDGHLLAQGESAEEVDTMWRDSLTGHFPSFYMADLNGDGLPEGIRSVWAGTSTNGIKWGYRPNAYGGLGPYQTWPMQAFTAGQEDKAYTAQVDGSGRTAFLVRDHGVDPYRYSALMLGPDGSPIKSVTTLKRTSATDSPYWFLDITGDGLTDALRIEDDYKPTGGKPYYQGGRLSVFINTGNGFLPGRTVELSPAVNWLGPTEYSDNPVTDYGIRVGEFNGDGRPDFFVANSISGRTKWLVLESQNDGTLKPRMLDVPLGDLAVLGFKMHQVLDVNGDGQSDILQVENGVVQLYLRVGEKPDLLYRVDDGQNTPTLFDHTYYNASNPYLAMDLPATPVSRGLWVVWRHSVADGTGGLSQYVYSYDDARMDLHGRGFLGFKTRTVLDAQTDATTTTEYAHLDTRVGTAYPYAGRPTLERTQVTTEDGVQHILERRTTYKTTAEANGQVLFAWADSITETRKEVPAGQSAANAVITYGQTASLTYDDFGNLTRSHSRSLYGGVATGDEVITESTYDNDTAGWLLGLQRSTSTTSIIPGGQSTTRRVDFQYEPATGLLKHETVEPTMSSLYLRTIYQRDALGRVVHIAEYDWGGNSRSTTIAYDAVEGTYPAVVTNGLGHQTRMAWHPSLGVQMAEQDANGIIRRFKYDGFGRVRGMESPDGANVSVSYGQRLMTSGMFGLALTVQQAGGTTRVIEYDEWDRPIWATEQGFDGEPVHHVRTYDSLGRLLYSYRPYTANETPRATEYTYDKLGRLRFERHPDGTFLEYRHSARLTERWDAQRNLHTFHRDALGRTEESTDVAPDGKRLQTRYTYGPFSTPTKMEQLTNGVLQHSTHLEYDLHGRQTRFLEYHLPSRLYLEYTAYNAWGELRQTTDASQRVTRLQRDRLGRIVNITNSDGQTRFTWDTGAGRGIGQLASTLSPDGVSSTHAYDALGRLEDTTWSVLGDTFQVTHQYDTFGRPLAILYPAVPGGARMQARFGYTASGQLQNIVGAPGIGTLWTAEARTATGHIKTELFGNGVRSSREYDPVRALLKRIDTTYQSATQTRTIQALAYDFDANGNLEARADELAGVSESFNYDHLDRLKDWTVTAQGRRSVHSYRYDDLGNFLGRDVLEGDGTPIALTYDVSKGFGPHAVTRSTLGDYTYDTNGNQVTAPGRRVEYTALDKPRRILRGADATLLGYTAEGQRAYKQSPNGDVTIYIGGIYERRKTATDILHVHHVPADGRIVAQEYWREAGGIITNVNRVFLHHDHLGSVETVTDQGGGIVRRAKYDPFGAQADPTNPAKALAPAAPGLVRWGFTGHEQDDELGLINMRGRMYDPLIGRFLSRDPFVQFPMSGQSYNRYAYVLNNPLRWTDPSGFLAQADDPDPVTDAVDTVENGRQHVIFCIGPCSEGEDSGDQGTTAEGESSVAEESPTSDDNGSTSTSVQSGGDNGKTTKQPGSDDKKKGRVTIESLQLALDAGGMIPGIGIAFDIASAGLSAYRGNWADAGMSLIGAVPGIGDAVKGAWLATKLGRGASRVGAVARRGLRQTGAGTASSAADGAYEAIRASTTDVAEIAASTGLKVSSVQKVKDHIFMSEHLLDRYVDYGVPAVMSRFDSSAGIAAAWSRLRAGTHTPADMSLLRHEAAEAWFMRRHGPGYSAAHNAAQRRFPAPDLGD